MEKNSLQTLSRKRKAALKLLLKLCLFALTFSFNTYAVDEGNLTEKKSSLSDDTPQILSTKIEVEREIKGREKHSFKVNAEAGNCVRLIVRQKGIDLITQVKNSAGKLVTEVDRPSGSIGRESVTFIAEESGDFSIVIAPLSARSLTGKYSILLEEISPPVEADRQRIVAEKLTTEGENLRFGGEKKVDAQLLEQALEKFQTASAIWEKLDDPYELAVIQYGFGWTYIPQGRYDKATLSFAHGLKLAQTLGDEYAQTLDYTGIGWSEFYAGNFETAVFNFNLAIEIARKNDYKSQTARSLFGLGNIAYMRGQYVEALDLLKECVRIRREINERSPENLTLITVAKVLVKQNKNADAIEYLKQILTFFKEFPDKRGEGETLITLGWAYYSIGEYKQAVDHFEQALQVRNNLGDKAGDASALRGLSVALAQQGDLQKAHTAVEKMFENLDSLRGENLNADTRLSFIASIQEYFADGISILMKMHEREPNGGYDRAAFEVNERSRSRVLLGLIQLDRKNIEKRASPKLLSQKQDLQQRLIENLIAEREMRATGKDLTKLKEQRLKIQEFLFSLRETDDEIQRQTEVQNKQNEKFSSPIIPLADIQKSLGNDTVLLEYWLGAERSFLWLVDGKKVLGFTLPTREIIEKSAGEVRDSLLLQKKDRIKGERDFERKASLLSEILIKPVLPHLKKQRLLIVPQGTLAYIPFAALPKRNAPLIIDHEISYLPSASLLTFLQKKNKTGFEKEIAVFADPVFSADDERLGINSQKNLTVGQKTERLFSSRYEAEKITSFVPPDRSLIALDTDASREKIIKTDLSRYRILHFATHANIDDEQPELSAVMLSNYDRSGEKTNGLLRSSEIINLNLNNEMVVLSGCRTGLGKNVRGEGFLNLSRSFMLSGTSRLLVSLWEIEDKTTAEFMARFYRKHLKEKMPASEALHATQLEFMKDARWRLPFYWSAFILQGDWK